MVDDPRSRADKDHVRRAVADRDSSDDLVLRGGNANDLGALIVCDPDRATSDPDVVRRGRTELDALRHSRGARIDAVEGRVRVERPNGAKTDGDSNHRP